MQRHKSKMGAKSWCRAAEVWSSNPRVARRSLPLMLQPEYIQSFTINTRQKSRTHGVITRKEMTHTFDVPAKQTQRSALNRVSSYKASGRHILACSYMKQLPDSPKTGRHETKRPGTLQWEGAPPRATQVRTLVAAAGFIRAARHGAHIPPFA